MTIDSRISRRSALGYALALGTAAGLTQEAVASPGGAAQGDFAFLTGSWQVRHRKLKSRLTGEQDWWEFGGTSRAWPLMDGHANLDDNLLEDPNGTYRGLTVRRLDPGTRQWSIWWLDEHTTRLDPPVVGSFEKGVGQFFADDTLRGMPIKVRYVWSDITARSARWEQAFSPDAGGHWEVNWIMTFTRQS